MHKILQKYDKAEGYIGICSYFISFCVISVLIMRHEEYKERIVYFGWGKYGIYDLALALRFVKKMIWFLFQFQKSFYKLDKKETAVSSVIKRRTYSCLFLHYKYMKSMHKKKKT